MKGLARTLIALLVAGALFAAMAIPALALNTGSGTAGDPFATDTTAADTSLGTAAGADPAVGTVGTTPPNDGTAP